MTRCSKCEEHYPTDSEIATCIRVFGECVTCKINNDGFTEDNLLWVKFVIRKDGLGNQVKH